MFLRKILLFGYNILFLLKGEYLNKFLNSFIKIKNDIIFLKKFNIL
jgi:hypothetical protein